MPRILILFYSRTDVTARAARDLARLMRKKGAAVTVERVVERIPLPYPLWLFLSFIPGSRWPIIAPLAAPGEFDATVLAFPKWTLCCPPIETLIRGLGGGFGKAALLVTCGGWDEERYLIGYAGKLARTGCRVVEAVALRKKEVGTDAGLERLEGVAEVLCGKAEIK